MMLLCSHLGKSLGLLCKAPPGITFSDVVCATFAIVVVKARKLLPAASSHIHILLCAPTSMLALQYAGLVKCVADTFCHLEAKALIEI